MQFRWSKLWHSMRIAVAAVALIALSVPLSRAQSNPSSSSSDDVNISVSDADRASATGAKLTFRHANYARTPAGAAARQKNLRQWKETGSSANMADNDFTQNPGDLSYQGGAVVNFAQSHAVYLTNGTCTIAGCWGNPEGFLRDLSDSDFIHVVDQYTGLHARERYTVGFRARFTGALPTTPLSTSDLAAFLHALVAATGVGGYRHIYHLFLPPGVDTCFDPPFDNQCYSPDNPATFVFCAYHGSGDFPDLGQHVLFTVEPFQAVPGCSNGSGPPNGTLIDSTNDTLSHETFETITDPDGDAFWNRSNFGLFGEEIGDECLFVDPVTLNLTEPTFRINGKLYRVQSEYSNQRHACAIAPGRN
jgi:hypothetical protein